MERITGSVNGVNLTEISADTSGKMTLPDYPEVQINWFPPVATIFIHGVPLLTATLAQARDHTELKTNRLRVNNPDELFSKAAGVQHYTIRLVRRI